jgi:hypothetical protein
MLLENTFWYDKRNLKKHIKQIQQAYGKISGLSLDRFIALRVACEPSIQEITDICDMLSEIFKSLVSRVQLVVIDEAVIGYQPSRKVSLDADASGEPHSSRLYSTEASPERAFVIFDYYAS